MKRKAAGILPNPQWLRRNGYAGLNLAMRKHPEVFAHIRQASRKGRTPEQWVPEADKLAKDHGGVLPHVGWLMKNGYGGLEQAMRKRPSLFAHIRQESKAGREPEEWVPAAEELAAQHGGSLPNPTWLRHNGYFALSWAMSSHPKMFAHIPQESKKGRPIDEWVALAKRVAAENSGLPSRHWLTKNGYAGLASAIQSRRQAFADIPRQDKKDRVVKKWLPIARQLAAEHNGVLPIANWLDANGYSGLTRAMQMYPEEFACIQQAKRVRRTPEEWVPVAEELAAQHDGVLPSYAWLQKAGYIGLCLAYQRRPELFAHLPQDRKRKRSPEEWVAVAEEVAQENDGIMPYDALLDRAGLGGLTAAMKRRPDLFAHFRRAGVLDKWIPVAERLAKEHGGALPSRQWLEKNGYNGLRMALRRRPELFTHVKP